MSVRRSLSWAATVVVKLDRSRAKRRKARSESICPLSTVLLSRIRSTVTSKFCSAAVMNSLLLSRMVCRSEPGVVERQPELGGDRAQVVLVDAAHRLVEVGEQRVGLDRRRGAVAVDLGVVGQERTLVALRLQLDVLLADGGAVADERVRVGGDVVELVVDVEHDVDAVVGEDQLAHLSHPHAAVGDLRALEGAAGVGEVGDHGVALVDQQAVEPGVAGADEADAEQRDEREDQQLHLGPTGDHRSTTIAGTSRLTERRVVELRQLSQRGPAPWVGRVGVRRRAGQAGQG